MRRIKDDSVRCQKLYIYPPENELNQYIYIQKVAVEKNGVQVTASLKDFFSTKFFLLNWFEKLGKTGKGFEFFKKLIKIAFLVVFRKKVFYVMHNRAVHSENTSGGRWLSALLRFLVLRISTKIIVLCDETIDVIKNQYDNPSCYLKKLYKIPHPNYIGFYAEPHAVLESHSVLRLLFTGRIQQYKNIEILIDCMNRLKEEPVELTVSGMCDDACYADSLKKMSKNPRTRFDFRYVPDNEISTLVASHDIIVLPYDMKSSLNSGNIFLAFSYKRTVISPLIGSLKEYADSSFFYPYSYETGEDHRCALYETMVRAIADWKQNPACLLEKGETAYNHVRAENSVEKIAALYAPLLV